jgi:hypothetical protein
MVLTLVHTDCFKLALGDLFYKNLLINLVFVASLVRGITYMTMFFVRRGVMRAPNALKLFFFVISYKKYPLNP